MKKLLFTLPIVLLIAAGCNNVTKSSTVISTSSDVKPQINLTQTYTNVNEDYTYKFPDNYLVMSTADNSGLAPVTSNSTSSYVMQSDTRSMVFSVNITNITSFTQQYINDFATSELPAKTAVSLTAVQVGNMSGFKATYDAATDALPSDRYYFQNQAKNVLELVVLKNNSVSAAILDSFNIFPAPDKNSSWKTYSNSMYGFQFMYPYYLDIEDSGNDSGVVADLIRIIDTTTTSYLGEIDIYSNNPVPAGADVNDWVITHQNLKYQTYSDGQFENKIGSSIQIDGLQTLHLLQHTNSGGTDDEFYFIKNGILFRILIEPQDGKNLNLSDSGQWYNAFVKSFKFAN
jgi:hypothetical protein